MVFITLVNGADFRRNDRCFVGFYSEAFCFSPAQEDMIDLLNDCVGCRSKSLGASSVELRCVCGLGNFSVSLFVSQR